MFKRGINWERTGTKMKLALLMILLTFSVAVETIRLYFPDGTHRTYVKGTDIGFTKNDGRRCNKCGSQLTSKVSKGIKCEL